MNAAQFWLRGPFRLALDRNNPIPIALLSGALRGVGAELRDEVQGASSITLTGRGETLPELLYVRLDVDWLKPGPDAGDIHPPLVTELIEALILARWWELAPSAQGGIVQWRPKLMLEWPPQLVERASVGRAFWPGGERQVAASPQREAAPPAALPPPELAQSGKEADERDQEWVAEPDPQQSTTASAVAPADEDREGEGWVAWLADPGPAVTAERVLETLAFDTKTIPPPDDHPRPAGVTEPGPPEPAPSEDAQPVARAVAGSSGAERSLLACVELHLSVHRQRWHESTYRVLPGGAPPLDAAESDDPVFGPPTALPFQRELDAPRLGVVGGGWLSRELVWRGWSAPSAQPRRWQVHLPLGGRITRDPDGALRVARGDGAEDITIRPRMIPDGWLKIVAATPAPSDTDGWVHLPRRPVSSSWLARALIDTTLPLGVGALMVLGILWPALLVLPQSRAYHPGSPAQVSAPSGCVLSNPSFVEAFGGEILSQIQGAAQGDKELASLPAAVEGLRVTQLCVMADPRGGGGRLEDALANACQSLQGLEALEGDEVSALFDEGPSTYDAGLTQIRDEIAGDCGAVMGWREAQVLGAASAATLSRALLLIGEGEQLGGLSPALLRGPVGLSAGAGAAERFRVGVQSSLNLYQSSQWEDALVARLGLAQDESPGQSKGDALAETARLWAELRPPEVAGTPQDALWTCAAELLRSRRPEPGGVGAFGVALGAAAGGALGASQLELDAALAAPDPAWIPPCWRAITLALPSDYVPAWPQHPIDESLDVSAQAQELGAQVCEAWARLLPHGASDAGAVAVSAPLNITHDLGRSIGVGLLEDRLWPPIALPVFLMQSGGGQLPELSSQAFSLACSCHLLDGGFLPTPEGLPQSLTDLLQPSDPSVCAVAPDSMRHSGQSCASAALMCGLSELLPLASRGSASTAHLKTLWIARFRAGARSNNPWCTRIGPWLDVREEAATIDQTCAAGVQQVRDVLMPALLASLVHVEAPDATLAAEVQP